MSVTFAIVLIGANILLLFALMGVPLGVVTFRRSVRIRAGRDRVWSALWPLGDNAGWSGTILSAEDLGDGHISAQLSWQARDGSPVRHLMAISDFAEGERFGVRIADDNTLDGSFWEHYARAVSLEEDAGETVVKVTTRDRYRGTAFMLFRYFALRRELAKLKIWAETGQYRAGGLIEHPATQFASAGVSTLIFWAAFGFTPTGFVQAALLTLVIALHELGHMAAFRLMGHSHARMIFVPLLGGLAIGGRPYNSHYEIAFSALMGSGFSAFLVPLSMACFAAATYADHSFLAQCAFLFGGFCALFNLANLLPIWKFDGGQVLRQLVQGETALAMASAVSLGIFLGLGWFIGLPPHWLAAVGVIVTLLSLMTRGMRVRPRHALVPMTAGERVLMAAALAAVTVTHASGLLWAARILQI